MEGWIKIHREIMSHPDYLSEPFTRMGAWIDLNLLANHKTGYIRVRGIQVEIGRGQVGVSHEELANRWKWSRGKVTRYLNSLEHNGIIVLRKNNVNSIIEILDYQMDEKCSENGTTKPVSNDTAVGTADDTPNETEMIQQNRSVNGNVSATKHRGKQVGGTTNETADNTTDGITKKTADSTTDGTANGQQTDTNKNNKNDNNTITHTDSIEFKIPKRAPEPAHVSAHTRAHAREILDWLSETYPKMMAMKEPLVEETAMQIAAKFNFNDVKRIFTAMHNKGAEKNVNTLTSFYSFVYRDQIIKDRKAAERGITFHQFQDLAARGQANHVDYEVVTIDGEKRWRLKPKIRHANQNQP